MLQTGSVLDRLLSADKLTDVTVRPPLGSEEVSPRPWLCAEWTVSAMLMLQQQPSHHREEAARTVTLLVSRSSCGVDGLGTNLNLLCCLETKTAQEAYKEWTVGSCLTCELNFQ